MTYAARHRRLPAERGVYRIEIYSDGHGGFVTATLLFQSGSLIDISDANILFTFETGADPLAFFHSGRFNFDTFIGLHDGSGTELFSSRYDLRTVFKDDTYTAYSADYRITRLQVRPWMWRTKPGHRRAVDRS